MSTFYAWLSVLIPDYEAIITRELLGLGYAVAPASSDGVLVRSNTIFYGLAHKTQVKTLADVEQDIHDILNKHKMLFHLIAVNEGYVPMRWRPTNISFVKPLINKKAPELPTSMLGTAFTTPEVESVMLDVKRILTPKGKEGGAQC